MGISDRIEAFICELMKEDDGWVELGRNELAGIFNCVPSQINYVMRTRFTPERGYLTESRRGGGGYIKIRRLSVDAHGVIDGVPDAIDTDEANEIIKLAQSGGLLDGKTAAIAQAGVCEETLSDKQRSAVLKAMLTAAVRG